GGLRHLLARPGGRVQADPRDRRRGGHRRGRRRGHAGHRLHRARAPDRRDGPAHPAGRRGPGRAARGDRRRVHLRGERGRRRAHVIGAGELGLIYGAMALGVYLTFRVLNFPDLTVDGSFTTGAATAAMGVLAGWNPVLATLAGFGTGFLAGVVTGLLHTKG